MAKRAVLGVHTAEASHHKAEGPEAAQGAVQRTTAGKRGRSFKLKAYRPSESQILASILAYLGVERRVLWAERMNSGKGQLLRPDGSQTWIRFGFKGCPDIIGQLRDGRALYVETKRAGGRVRPEQRAFIDAAAAHGAVAVIARSVEEVMGAIDE